MSIVKELQVPKQKNDSMLWIYKVLLALVGWECFAINCTDRYKTLLAITQVI